MIADSITEYYPYITSAQQIFSVHGGKKDMRPYLKDPNTNRQQLVDTGAVVSCWPRKDYPEAAIDTSILLEAVNKTRIATYGKVTRAVKIGRKTYNTEFILADIETPVLGWDFIVQHKIKMQT